MKPATPLWDTPWPTGHPLSGYNPAQLVPCASCGLHVGARNGRLNKHVIGKGNPANLNPGERPSPLGPDGWCIG